jgi:hypothetical protein
MPARAGGRWLFQFGFQECGRVFIQVHFTSLVHLLLHLVSATCQCLVFYSKGREDGCGSLRQGVW